MSQSSYQKLPGRGRTWGGRSRVWLGADHLLLVLTRGYVENYRRFFFNDIQGIIVRRTKTANVWSVVWAIPGALCLAFMAALNGPASLVMACLAVPFVVALVINLAVGATCACYIRTAVQTERIPAVSRVRAAEKFIARIEPLIVGAQGELLPEQLTTDLQLLQAGQLNRVTEAPRADVPPVIS